MLKFLARRIAAAAFLIAVAATIVFFSIHLLPGDPVLILLGEQGAANAEVVARIRDQLNLDAPLYRQYIDWVSAIAVGDFGSSLQSGLPVAEELARRIPRSLELIAAGLAIATLFGLPLGIVAARRRNAPSGLAASAIAVLGFSSPVFVTGILLVLLFSLWLGVLPSSGYVAFADDPVSHLSYALLPALTIGINFMGVVTRMTRASLADVLRRDFVRAARARGLSQAQAVYRHALPNALIPVVAILGVRAGNLLGGTVIIEALFDWPGISSLLVSACFARDYPMIQGSLVAIFAMFALISLAVDVLQGMIDPRVRA
jgi:peptide/nickel transport system permease protein